MVLAACSGTRPTTSAPPPVAEFLLSSVDSTFWVTTTAGHMRVRGAPLTLARYDGRFYELFASDDDQSYDDAQLVGERLYRRDLLTGDSTLIFADTTVQRIAVAYARAHPDERPLEPDEEGQANPSTTATAEVEILEVFGPYVSYEYHVDVDLPGRRPWHSTRRGVVDLRSGKARLATDLFGMDAGQRLIVSGRGAFESERDSIARKRPELVGDDRRAADAVERARFDPRSFTVSADGDRPAIMFGVPGQGEGAAGNVLELEPLRGDSVPWWSESRPGLARADSAGNDVWDHRRYRVIARYDSAQENARVSISDSSKHEWPIATVQAPLRRIEWLDQPPVGDAERRALARAFDEAATYDQNSRVASARSATAPLFFTSHAPTQDRTRKPARDVRTHDARACQQPGPCVWRSGALHDGQMRGDRGVQALPRRRGHRVDRPRGFPRAHSPG